MCFREHRSPCRHAPIYTKLVSLQNIEKQQRIHSLCSKTNSSRDPAPYQRYWPANHEHIFLGKLEGNIRTKCEAMFA